MENKFATFILVFILGALIFLCVKTGTNTAKLGSSMDYNELTTVTAVSTSIPSTGKNTILAGNGARSYAIIQNVSTTATCYIHFGDATSTNNDYILKGDSYVIDNTNLFTGKITGHCSPSVYLQIVEAQ